MYLSKSELAAILAGNSSDKLVALVDAWANFNVNPNGIGTIAWCELGRALLAYEATGDHDHSAKGNRPIPVGSACPGGDCWVAKARRALVDATLRSAGSI